VESPYLKKINKKKALGYVLMPGILPRTRELFEGTFGYVAFLMAQIYNMVCLIPNNHPYMNPQNIGKFSIRNVIAEAAQNLVIKKENIDQILIFFALLVGTVLLVLQIFILLYGLFIEPAIAQNPSVNSPFSLFTTPDPVTSDTSIDIAFIIMDRVFGIPNFFCSIGNKCTEIIATRGPNPFQKGMQNLFQFYSYGILFIAALIFLYFIVVVTVETAISGTPFGQRFQNVWVPIRLVVAIGLLLPIGYGYSTGQYIAFYAAKAGSGLATNGWNLYNKGIATGGNSNPTGEHETLIPYPTPQDISPVVQAMNIVTSCAYAYYIGQGQRDETKAPPSENALIKAYLVKTVSPESINKETSRPFVNAFTADYKKALEFYDGGNIAIRFGIKDDEKFTQYKGGVEPTCGEIKIPVHNGKLEHEHKKYVDPLSKLSATYFLIIGDMWKNNKDISDFASRIMEINIKRHENSDDYPCQFASNNAHFHNGGTECYTKNAKASWRSDVISTYQSTMNTQLATSWEEMTQDVSFKITDEVKDRGWGGAGIWYNKIAQVNGDFIAATVDVPYLEKYPLVMEQVKKANKACNQSPDIINQFEPRCSSSSAGEYNTMTIKGGRAGLDIAKALSQVHKYWNIDGHGDITAESSQSPNFLVNMFNLLLGTNGLFNMRENSRAHPLAQLVGLGKSLVEAGVRNMAFSGTTAFMGGIAGAFQGQRAAAPALLNALAGMFKSTAFLGMTAGFILFYIVPFLPFIYSFFAVGGWVKTIFESMVGIPLWALAHLRIDGEGLPGEAAQNGYFMILEIFIRPILIIFGLIAAITIFTAQIRVLNIIWDLVIANLGGFSDKTFVSIGGGAGAQGLEFKRSAVDEFFFTIIYAIVVYMMAIASFKLIDTIPKSILRWAGTGASAFGDINEDPKELQRYAALGGITVGQKIADSTQNAASGIGGTLGRLGARTNKNT